MAMLDDPDWLLQHIRHSFITSDDTGMCEMVLQDNDMVTLEQHRHRIKSLKETKRAERAKKNQKKGLPDSFGRSTPVGSPHRSSETASTSSTNTSVVGSDDSGDVPPLGPSPDILSGWDFGVRRRSNTAQKLERIRKERQSRVKVNSIPWRKKNTKITEEQLQSMFEKKELHGAPMENKHSDDESISKNTATKVVPPPLATSINVNLSSPDVGQFGFVVENDGCTYQNAVNVLQANDHIDSPEPQGRKRGMSALSRMLLQSTEQYDSPFREYSKFDGDGHGNLGVKKVDIFVWPNGAERPKFSMTVTVLAQKAKVQDVIGLTCWKYSMENQKPKLTGKTVQRFSLHIAEDDGTVDEDFPPLDPIEPFSKFSFSILALVEKRAVRDDADKTEERGVKETVFVKVNDYEGSSLVQVDDLNVTMGEILKRTLKRRKGQNYTGKYVLEYQDKVGVAVEESQTLESTGVMEFYLRREHSSRNNVPPNAFDGNVKALTEKASPSNDEYRFPPDSRTPTQTATDKSFIFVPTSDYTVFRLYQLRKLRSPVPVAFGVGPNQIDVEPEGRRESRSAITQLLSPRAKSLSIRVAMLAYCAIQDGRTRSNSLSVSPPSSSGSFSSSLSSFANQDSVSSTKSYDKSVFKLYYRLSEYHSDFKHLTLEGPSDEVQEAVEKVQNVMMLGGNKRLQDAFETFKFGPPQSLTSSSNSTVSKRKGSMFW